MHRSYNLLFVLLLAVQSFASSVTITPTTTLSAQTANNTSASSSFAALPNGDPTPGNVSKLPIRNLLPGFTGKVLAHYMPWWGKSGHIDIGQSSHDAAQAEAIVQDMISRGYDGVMVSEANSNDYDQQGALTMFAAVQNHPGFLFAISDNSGAYSGTTNVTATLLANMDFSNTHYFQSPNYLRINGRPVVYVFDNISGINWTTVQSQAAGNPIFIFRNKSGFTPSYSSGAFSWVGFPSSTDSTGLGYLDGFYTTAMTYPTKVATGSAWKGFNDTVASWTKDRIIPQRCGNLWMDSMTQAMQSMTAGPAVMKIATWNDYEEGTETETGIDNCATMSASVSSGVLNFAPTFSDASGSVRTIDHYEVYISQDSQNLMKLTDLAVGNTSLKLSNYSLAAGTYQLYVKMVGQPGIINRMSSAATYSVAPPPPPPPAPTPVPTASVVITSPTNNYAKAGQWIEVKATASSSTTISAMRVLVDGTAVTTINNVTKVDYWTKASLHKWHTLQVWAWTNHAWVKSSPVKVYVSH
jgi:hypothetical protein